MVDDKARLTDGGIPGMESVWLLYVWLDELYQWTVESVHKTEDGALAAQKEYSDAARAEGSIYYKDVQIEECPLHQ